MKYCFTTLAVGEPYESRTMEFYKNMRELTTNCDFFITTCNTDFPEMGDRIYTNFINPPSLHYTQGGFSFHVNLKCLSLKHVITHEKQMLKENPDFQKYDYIIFKVFGVAGLEPAMVAIWRDTDPPLAYLASLTRMTPPRSF